MIEWLRTATKEERHCKEMEDFAKRHPIIFMKYHKHAAQLVKAEMNSDDYLKAKEMLIELFNGHKEQFEPVFEAVRKMKNKTAE